MFVASRLGLVLVSLFVRESVTSWSYGDFLGRVVINVGVGVFSIYH